MKPIILVPLVALVLVAALVAACAGSANENSTSTMPPEADTPAPVVTAQLTPTPTPAPGGAGGGGLEGTVVPITTPFPSPPPVPADWANYTDPDGRFTLRYPRSWFIQDGATSKIRPPGELTTILSTFELGTVGPRFPRGSIKLDVIVQRNDPANPPGANCQAQPQGATSTSLGAISGWERLVDFAPSYDLSPDGVTRSHAVVAFRDGYCFGLTTYFAQDNPDESTFLQIIDSFTFTD